MEKMKSTDGRVHLIKRLILEENSSAARMDCQRLHSKSLKGLNYWKTIQRRARVGKKICKICISLFCHFNIAN